MPTIGPSASHLARIARPELCLETGPTVSTIAPSTDALTLGADVPPVIE
jgi:hypothetical protein